MLKAIGIAGSPRKKGNSTALLKAALAGAEKAGAETQVVYLNSLTYHGCQDCTPACTADATCHVEDELTPVQSALREADIWMLASPIYYDGVTGQMKTFFDRCRHLTREAEKFKPQLAGRRAAAIIVTYADKSRDDYRRVAEVLAAYLKWMGDFGDVEIMSESNLGPADAVAARPDLLEQAETVGRKLAESLTRP